jgi:hypothetical protein
MPQARDHDHCGLPVSGMWQCDGCDVTGTLAEVETHVLAQPDEGRRCWGALEVGGPAWFDYHVNGVHPMTTVTDIVRRRLNDAGL